MHIHVFVFDWTNLIYVLMKTREKHWVAVEFNFGRIEQNICLMSNELADLFEVPKKRLRPS